MYKFRIIQGCPCNAQLAPYVQMLVQETKATVNSIYRGSDAAFILHQNGKHTQAELYATLPAGTANPPGRSTHELKSDGVAYQGPVGRQLQWWQQGIDVNDGDVNNMVRAAHQHGWLLFQPYKAGVEFHHVNFRIRPTARNPIMKARIALIRARLPHA